MPTMAEALEKYKAMTEGIEAKVPKITGTCQTDCEICGGIGFVRYAVPSDHFLFGKTEPCPKLSHNRLMELGNFGLRYDEQNELSWDSLVDYNATLSIAAKIRHELENQPGAWIFLYGAWGLAKSLILKVAVAVFLRHGRHAHYVSMVDLLDDLRLAFDEENQSRALEEKIVKWSTIPFLAIDEFEKTNPTPWVMERMFQIFDRRYNLAVHGEASTLIASNLKPAEFRPEFRSRIMDGRGLVLELKGTDIRPRMTREDKF